VIFKPDGDSPRSSRRRGRFCAVAFAELVRTSSFLSSKGFRKKRRLGAKTLFTAPPTRDSNTHVRTRLTNCFHCLFFGLGRANSYPVTRSRRSSRSRVLELGLRVSQCHALLSSIPYQFAYVWIVVIRCSASVRPPRTRIRTYGMICYHVFVVHIRSFPSFRRNGISRTDSTCRPGVCERNASEQSQIVCEIRDGKRLQRAVNTQFCATRAVDLEI